MFIFNFMYVISSHMYIIIMFNFMFIMIIMMFMLNFMFTVMFIDFAKVIEPNRNLKSSKLQTKSTGLTSSADWVFDKAEMASLFNEKTKGIVLNTPHNPVGKVFTLDELQFIADLAKKWNTLVVSDEVYEWMVYEPAQHIRIATLPGMYERTITIGSAGKTFSVTGWKTGWAYGPANLLNNLKIVHQNCVYTCATPIQVRLRLGSKY